MNDDENSWEYSCWGEPIPVPTRNVIEKCILCDEQVVNDQDHVIFVCESCKKLIKKLRGIKNENTVREALENE